MPNSNKERMTTTTSYDYRNRLTSISSAPSTSSAINFNYPYNSANQRIHPARFQEELRLMHGHEDWKIYLAISLFFALNGAWIYYYFQGTDGVGVGCRNQ
jgi:hypothetical protein